jgi:hypothetical protein
MIEVEIMTAEESVDVDIQHEEPEIKAAIDFSGEALRIGGDGLSAYEIALKNGFEGTEEEWLESLKGEDGYTPVKGVDYFDGKDGAPGANGKDGADGKDGKDGVDGAKGADGKDGASISHYWNGTALVISSASGTSPGVDLKGAKGDTGPQGTKGDKGDKGDTGSQGAGGPQGPKGDTGPQGPKGDKGDTGANGKDGADGKTPVKGTDYWTPADKAAIVADVIAALPVYNGEVVSV